jgi:cytoskeletal protein CcmA (bactofilin family)
MFSSLKKSQSAAPRPLESKSSMGASRLQDESNDGRLRGLATSIIGPELTIAGNLITKGQVQIDGEIEGDVHGIHVLVAEGGCITGLISADEVIVRGRVMGSIRGKRVMLKSSCHVAADVFHDSLTIEDGAAFEGQAHRSAKLVPQEVRPTKL